MSYSSINVLIEKELTFEQAEDYCQIIFDTHLATIIMRQGIYVQQLQGRQCGIGLNDRTNEGTFEWIDATEYNAGQRNLHKMKDIKRSLI